MHAEYESDLEALIFRTKHKVVKLKAEIHVLEPKVEEILDEVDLLAAYLLFLQSSENTSEETKTKEKDTTKELVEKWPVRRWLTESLKRARQELKETEETLLTLLGQQLHFELVHRN